MLRAIVLVVALLAGGLAAYLALATRSAPTVVQVQAPPPLPTQDVLVAAEDLKQGETLTDKNLRWQAWPDNSLNESFFLKSKSPDQIKTLTGSLVRTPFVSGEPIRDAKLAHPGSGFLSAILPAGKRAVAVRVSADTTAGGFILPNDSVDVIQTTGQKGQNGENNASDNVSRTILTNVLVLAIEFPAHACAVCVVCIDTYTCHDRLLIADRVPNPPITCPLHLLPPLRAIRHHYLLSIGFHSSTLAPRLAQCVRARKSVRFRQRFITFTSALALSRPSVK